MAAQDLHEVAFEWPHPEPTAVIVTGTFDEWSCSVHMTKTPTGFVGTTKIPWGEKVKFKYVVDGKWVLHENQSIETDPGGFVNHVYTAPPAPPAQEAPSTALNPEQAADSEVVDSDEPDKDKEPIPNGHAKNGDAAVTEPAEQPAGAIVETPAAGAAEEVDNHSDSEPKASAVYPPGYPQFLSDIADTIVARDGTSSTLDYVASGLGAAIHSVVGVDPINIQQIAIPTPKPGDAFTIPGGPESAPNSAALPTESTSAPALNPEVSEPLPSPVAPIVPILIVPVNAAENNTIAPELELVATPLTVTEVMAPAEAAPEATVAPIVEAAKAAEEASIVEPTVPDVPSTVEAESPPTVSDTPTESTILKDETIEAAPVIVEEATSPAPEPESTASVEPVAEETAPASESEPVVIETKVMDVALSDVPQKEPEVVAVVEEAVANVKTEDLSIAEPEALPATSVEEMRVEASASEPVLTHDADDLIADIRAEALAQIPVEPVEVKDEPVPEAFAPAPESVQEGSAAPKMEEPIAAEPEPVSVTEAVKDEEPISSKPNVEQTPVSELTIITVEPTIIPNETPTTKTEAVIKELPPCEELAVPQHPVEDVPTKAEETAAPHSNGESVIASKAEDEELSTVEEAATVTVEEPSPEVPTIEELVAEVKAEEVHQEAIIPAAEKSAIEIKEEIAEPVSESVSDPTPADIVPELPTTAEDKASKEPTTVSEVSQVVTETPTPQPVEKAEAVVRSIPESELVVKAPTEVAVPETTPAAELTPANVPIIATEPSAVQPIPIASEPSSDSTTDQPSSNGHAATVTAEPTTPSKEKKVFPSSSKSATASAENSPSSSKFNTQRKKRSSILGKLKNIFHSDKEKEKEKK